ncbi:MAG TPA: di-heme oxidoredictase family protein, partial [Longimicrobiales bacterium]|nr:di-heme oxidoredictase family protein [Longimicrobiales bacterium]
MLVSVLGACATEPVASPAVADIGDPVPGLTSAELARFEAGRVSFNRQFTPEDGLGPRFNENSCNACHTSPSDGGTGETIVTKATRTDVGGTCDALGTQGGENLRLRVTPLAAAAGAQRPPTPTESTHQARFTIPFLFGLGLVDAVPQSTLDALADPDDADGNGISGRVGTDPSGRPARFGRKADVATLADFTGGAFRLEMGLTIPSHPLESAAGDMPPTGAGTDPAPDPELEESTLTAVVDFVRLLAPPATAQPEDTEGLALVQQGQELFSSLGCVTCHVPSLESGPSDIPALSHKIVPLYSDLLLHDMGPGLEGTCGPGASTREWRTEPLMGLRHRRLFLHDGRVGRVLDAILAHGGEAEEA